MIALASNGAALLSSGCVEFRATLARHIRELERERPERESTAWFFLRYLKRVARRAEGSPSPRAADGAMRGLVRYYVDALERDGQLERRFEEVLAAHRHALRSEIRS